MYDILLIEDNPDDVLLTQRAFKKAKIANDLVVIGDGAEALDYLFLKGEYEKSDRVLPHLILLDLKLPKVDGLELLKQIRTSPQLAIIPVVVLTTSNEQVDLIQSYQLGANSYIRKPVNFQSFVEAVQQLGLYWLVLNQTPD